MLSRFYQKQSRTILWVVALSFPFLVMQTESLPTNNDIETWLPGESDVRVTYEEFKEQFGGEEIILIGLEVSAIDERLVEAVCRRIERLTGIRRCWSPGRLRAVMADLGVSYKVIDRRLHRLAVSEDGRLIGLIAQLSEMGLEYRAGTVGQILEQLQYCQLRGNDVCLAGSPVLIAELDRLGSPKQNKRFFLVTLLISLILLFAMTRQWKLSFAILGLTIWAINLTMTTVKLAGGEMNFILGALSVMVMVFTLAIIIHLLHYYRAAWGEKDPLAASLRRAWKPCVLATLTTVLGLLSLTVSEFDPVRQFGYAASAGSLIALLVGLGLTPALLTLWPNQSVRSVESLSWFSRAAHGMLDHSRSVAVCAGLLVVVAGLGLARIESKIDPLEFLPQQNKVLVDQRRIEKELTNVDSIEAVVDFGDDERTFGEKLDEIRRLEAIIAAHPAVRHTMSAATFLPEELPTNAFTAAAILGKARSRQDKHSDYMAEDGQAWRISARVRPNTVISRSQTFVDLSRATSGAPIRFTGLAPLLDHAQSAIFDGFWESFSMAFGVITVVMVLSLRSIKMGLLAMIPNLTPICIVFGVLGWIGFPVDIGMMMTGSIALGIAVDGTFHFLVRYQEQQRHMNDSAQAARSALLQTGAPIFKAAAIGGTGMLALGLSHFAPTARFGVLMAMLLFAALIGDLVLLPAVLSLRNSKVRPGGVGHRLADRRPGFLRLRQSLKLHRRT